MEEATPNVNTRWPQNLMLMLDRETPDDAMIPQHLVPSTRPSTHQRCFNQFDRITQTRQGHSLNKYQCDSQNLWVVAVSGGCIHEAIESDCRAKGCSTHSHPAIWQKPGIALAGISPVRVRETIRKRKSVPGVIPIREKP